MFRVSRNSGFIKYPSHSRVSDVSRSPPVCPKSKQPSTGNTLRRGFSLRRVRLLEAVSASERRSRGGAASERGGTFGRRPGMEVAACGRQLGVAHGVFDAHEVNAAGDKQ